MPLMRRTIRHRDERGAVEYTVYTKEEADKLEIKYKPWYECVRGDWGISDDDVVAECVTVQKMPYQRFIVFPYGTGIIGRHNKELKYSVVSKFNNPYNKYKDKSKVKKVSDKVLKAFAYAMVATRFDYAAAYQYIHPNTSRKSALFWGKVMMETQRGSLAVFNAVQQILEAKGVSKDKTLDYLLDAIEMAKEKGDLTNYNRSVETLLKIQDMMPKQTTRHASVQLKGEVKDWTALLNTEHTKLENAKDAEIAEEANGN